MTFSNCWGLFHNATHMLCSEGTQRERLINATCELGHVRADSLPAELIADFKSHMNEMRVVTGTNGEGAFAATINSFSTEQIQKAIDNIVGFYDSICRHREP